MYTTCFVLRARRFFFRRVSDVDHAERIYVLGDVEDFANSVDQGFDGVQANPYCAKSQPSCRQQDVFCGCAAILLPELMPGGVLRDARIAQDNDGNGGIVAREEQFAAQFRENLRVGDDDKFPGL